MEFSELEQLASEKLDNFDTRYVKIKSLLDEKIEHRDDIESLKLTVSAVRDELKALCDLACQGHIESFNSLLSYLTYQTRDEYEKLVWLPLEDVVRLYFVQESGVLKLSSNSWSNKAEEKILEELLNYHYDYSIISEVLSSLILSGETSDDEFPIFFSNEILDVQFKMYLKLSEKIIDDINGITVFGLSQFLNLPELGLVQNIEKGLINLKKSSSMGCKTAPYFLGAYYFKHSPDEAVKWFSIAAERNHPIACFRLALIFDVGLDPAYKALDSVYKALDINKSRSQEYYKKSYQGGFLKAKNYII